MSARKDKNHVCPMEKAGNLDSRLRRWLQNPRKILKPHLEEGMKVLDMGCGPGFFVVEMAEMVGASGQVIACDLQQGMLDIVAEKVQGTELESRITLHKCEASEVGVTEPVDFVLLFYMVHELPSPEAFFAELSGIVHPGGRVLIVEPPFHVSKADFTQCLQQVEIAGFRVVSRPWVFFGKTALLEMNGE